MYFITIWILQRLQPGTNGISEEPYVLARARAYHRCSERLGYPEASRKTDFRNGRSAICFKYEGIEIVPDAAATGDLVQVVSSGAGRVIEVLGMQPADIPSLFSTLAR